MITKTVLSELVGQTRIEQLANIIYIFDCKIGVEVGVREGHLSYELLTQTELSFLYGIDVVPISERASLIKDFAHKYKFILNSSPGAAHAFEDGYFDFVYIDNDHQYNHVKKELPIWYKKVKMGGVLLGHDFMNYEHPVEGKFGVQQAVIEFCNENKLHFNILGCKSNKIKDMIEYCDKIAADITQHDNGGINYRREAPSWIILKEDEI